MSQLVAKHTSMNKINSTLGKFYKYLGFIVPGTFIFGMFQFPLSMPKALPTPVANVTAGEIADMPVKIAITEEFFGKEAYSDKTQETIEQKIDFVSTRKAYPASLAVIQKHEDTIRERAAKNGVPKEVAIGVGLLENGGSDTAKSPAGALGVYQLMPGTARNLGLKVDKKIDERRNPKKNIDAGMRYLRANFDRFGDWGLATWAYHAGEGNVVKALKIYAKANYGVTLPGVGEWGAHREFVEKYNVNINKLLSDPSVKKFTNKLKDDSSGYPYKVIATATLFEEAEKALEVAEK